MRTSILLALVTGALMTGSTTAGAAAATPRCTTAALEVWLGVGGGGGQAGSVSYPMELTNVSGHTCHLFGFPGVSAEAAGHQLGSAARRDHSAPEQTASRFGPARPRTRCSGSRTSRRSRRRAADRWPPTGSRFIRPARSPRPRSRSGFVRARRRGPCSCRSRRCSRGSAFPGIRSRGSLQHADETGVGR